jgi:hypothetical protein
VTVSGDRARGNGVTGDVDSDSGDSGVVTAVTVVW